MVKAISYPRIVWATIWRQFLVGVMLGILLGLIESPNRWLLGPKPMLPLAAIYLGVLGGIMGLILGIKNGLYLSSVTWLCRPRYQTRRFIQFCTISSAVLSFMLVVLCISALPQHDPRPFINPFPVIAALLSAVVSAWAVKRVALRIAARDHAIKNDDSEENHDNL